MSGCGSWVVAMHESELPKRETFLSQVVLRAAADPFPWRETKEVVQAEGAAPHGGLNVVAVVLERETGEPHRVTGRDVADAFKILKGDLRRGGANPGPRWVERMFRHRARHDAHGLGAIDADWLLQYGLYGAIVY